MGEKCQSLGCREFPPRTELDVGVNGLRLDDVSETTAIVTAHLHFEGTPSTPLVPPVYHTSTYQLNQPEDLLKCMNDGGSCYGRCGNPSEEALEASINVLEKGAGSLTFACGMGAVSSVLMACLAKGDHVIIQNPGYSCTLTILKHLEQNFGVELSKIADADFDLVVKCVKPNTKMIWLETPCNPEVIVVDVRQMTDFARSKGILVAVDGTFASPYAQKAVQLGADFSVHSCTKYMGGHSDLTAGCVTTRTMDQWRRLKKMQMFLGNILSPQESSLLLRSLKTLPIRMEQISSTALKVAEFLEKHPKVSRVHYPGLPSHPQHQLACRQMKVFSGMIMVDIKGGGEGGRTVAMNTKVFKIAVSLGGVESLLNHPYSMTHGPYVLSDDERAEARVTPGMLRVSIGLEDPEDLIRDLDQALAKVVV